MKKAALVLSITLLAACGKKDAGDTTAAATTAPSAPPAPAASSPSVIASAAPVDPPASSAPSPSASASAPQSGSAAPVAAAGQGGAAKGATTPAAAAAPAVDAGPTCGKKPLPDCPMQAWMKRNTAAAMASSDLPALATALDQIVKFAPAGYTNWASISRDGAAAARAGNTDAVKASCRGCHDQYRSKYRTDMRAHPLP